MHAFTNPTPSARPACGIGLRGPHMDEILATRPRIGWFEVHPENYMGGGSRVATLELIRRDYPLSLHGVGLSVGSADGIDAVHLERLARMVDRFEPILVSEHLSWSIAGGAYLNDLLPLPYTEEALDVVARNVDRAQTRLGRRFLIENPSRYLDFVHSTMEEGEFLAQLVARTGCGILCDVNNLHVSAVNCGLDIDAWFAAIPPDAVGEIHLAGHAVKEVSGKTLLIDDHGAKVSAPVWTVYAAALARFPEAPPLVEWDANLPGLDVLLAEAAAADDLARAIDREDERHARTA